MSSSLQPHGLYPARLPCSWNSPGKNSGAGCISFSRGSSQPRDQTRVSCIAGGFFTIKSQGQDSNPLLPCCKASAPNQYPYCPCPHSPPFTHTHTHTHTHTAILTWLSLVFPPGSSPAEELSCQPAEDHSWGMRCGAYRASPLGASGSFSPYFNSQWAPRPPCPQLRFLPCRPMKRKSPERGRWKATAPSFEGEGSSWKMPKTPLR